MNKVKTKAINCRTFPLKLTVAKANELYSTRITNFSSPIRKINLFGWTIVFLPSEFVGVTINMGQCFCASVSIEVID